MGALITDFTGEIAALTAALIWAIASSIYASLGKQVSPLVLNLAKGIIAIACIGLTLLLRPLDWPTVPGWATGLLLLSGAIGIGLGDTAFFTSLNCLGARRGLLLESLAPPMAALIAFATLREILPWQAWIGILLTVAGVGWVVVERTPQTEVAQMQPRRGILAGMLAALAQAVGAVMSRAALMEASVDPLWSTGVRLLGGLWILIILVGWQRQQSALIDVGRSPRVLATVALTAVMGTYIAIWLQQTALKFTEAGIAQALGATSPLFVIPIAIWMGDRVSGRAVAGMAIALAGIWLLFR